MSNALAALSSVFSKKPQQPQQQPPQKPQPQIPKYIQIFISDEKPIINRIVNSFIEYKQSCTTSRITDHQCALKFWKDIQNNVDECKANNIITQFSYEFNDNKTATLLHSNLIGTFKDIRGNLINFNKCKKNLVLLGGKRIKYTRRKKVKRNKTKRSYRKNL